MHIRVYSDQIKKELDRLGLKAFDRIFNARLYQKLESPVNNGDPVSAFYDIYKKNKFWMKDTRVLILLQKLAQTNRWYFMKKPPIEIR